MKTSIVVLLLAAAALSGCRSMMPHSLMTDTSQQPGRLIRLTAIGYGTASAFERYPEGQKKLMAMRASKLDAYRALAEQIYGVRVTGSSTVGAMMVQNDSFRVSLDAYIRGARIVHVGPIADGNYETTVEMDFDESVVRTFAMPPSVASSASTVAGAVYSPGSLTRGAAGPGVSYGANYYYGE